MPENTFIKPQYGGRSFADLPQTIISLLTDNREPAIDPDAFGTLPRRYDRVIFFFIDAFGWRFFEKYADNYPFLKQIVRRGHASKFTSQFPSTTSAHTTTIHTGLPVAQSGIFEWQYYEPALDSIITPLLFSFAGTTKRDTLKPTGIDPKTIYPTQTLYQTLNRHGINSTIFQYQAYACSTYSDVVFDGAEVLSFSTFPEALVNMQAHIKQNTTPSYYFLYYADIDSICHKYGPTSPQVEAEIDNFLTMMDRLFMQRLDGKLKNTLLMVTADHGQVEIDPDTTILINRDSRFSGIDRFIKTNQRGKLLANGGSARDMFMYIKDDLLDEAQSFLATRLEGVAEVHKVADLIEAGYFGPEPVSAAFSARMSNLVVLPYRYQSVWWHEDGDSLPHFYGHHGGLTPQEMEIPLLLYAF